MLDDQIIRMTVTKYGCDVVQPLMGEMSIDGIHNSDFFIKDHIRIIGHAIRYNILSLKQINLMVIDTYISDIVCDFHKNSSFPAVRFHLSVLYHIKRNQM